MSNDSSTVPAGAKVKFGGIGLVLGLVVGGIGAGKVAMDKQGQLDNVAEQLEITRTQGHAKTAELAKAADTATSRQKVYAARVLVAQAIGDFDDNNYGAANQKLANAAAALKAVDPALAGIEPSARDAALGALQQLKLMPGVDPIPQRAALRASADQLDGLVAKL